jgi:hypothetical protein
MRKSRIVYLVGIGLLLEVILLVVLLSGGTVQSPDNIDAPTLMVLPSAESEVLIQVPATKTPSVVRVADAAVPVIDAPLPTDTLPHCRICRRKPKQSSPNSNSPPTSFDTRLPPSKPNRKTSSLCWR